MSEYVSTPLTGTGTMIQAYQLVGDGDFDLFSFSDLGIRLEKYSFWESDCQVGRTERKLLKR